MSDKPECNECDEEIDGQVVWYRPFGAMVQEDAQTWRFVGEASKQELPHSRPFHPKCFVFRTGHKWPPDSK
jgi:hypothetical protein